jgi:hypothetical protein
MSIFRWWREKETRVRRHGSEEALVLFHDQEAYYASTVHYLIVHSVGHQLFLCIMMYSGTQVPSRAN